ncbi:MAG: NADPH-dependent FMN reductase [Candidatus Sericytochromatia bacterium]
MKILAVYGSTGPESQSSKIIGLMAEAARAAGAELEMLDLLATPLPLFRTDRGFEDEPVVARVRRNCEQAEGFMLVSPEYHGCMSSWMKNFFDFHYHEFAGKLFALAASTGGSMGVSCNTQMRVAVQHCHGWALPYQVALRQSDFDEAGAIRNAGAVDRLERMGRDLVIYGRLLYGQFQADRAAVAGGAPEDKRRFGFAGWYA